MKKYLFLLILLFCLTFPVTAKIEFNSQFKVEKDLSANYSCLAYLYQAESTQRTMPEKFQPIDDKTTQLVKLSCYHSINLMSVAGYISPTRAKEIIGENYCSEPIEEQKINYWKTIDRDIFAEGLGGYSPESYYQFICFDLREYLIPYGIDYHLDEIYIVDPAKENIIAIEIIPRYFQITGQQKYSCEDTTYIIYQTADQISLSDWKLDFFVSKLLPVCWSQGNIIYFCSVDLEEIARKKIEKIDKLTSPFQEYTAEQLIQRASALDWSNDSPSECSQLVISLFLKNQNIDDIINPDKIFEYCVTSEIARQLLWNDTKFGEYVSRTIPKDSSQCKQLISSIDVCENYLICLQLLTLVNQPDYCLLKMIDKLGNMKATTNQAAEIFIIINMANLIIEDPNYYHFEINQSSQIPYFIAVGMQFNRFIDQPEKLKELAEKLYCQSINDNFSVNVYKPLTDTASDQTSSENQPTKTKNIFLLIFIIGGGGVILFLFFTRQPDQSRPHKKHAKKERR